MAQETPFAQGTIVEDEFLNSTQEILTGVISGFRLAPGTANTQVKLTPYIQTNSTTGVRGQLVAIEDNAYLTAWTSTTVENTAYAAGAASVGIWAKTTAAYQTTNGDGTFEVVVSATRPTSSFVRKVGEATASGGNVLSDIRMLTGTQADADQWNNFTFRTVLNSAAEIPLTLRGQAAQNTSGAKMLSVGFDTAGVYGEKWYVNALGQIVSKQAAATDVHYAGFVGAEANARIALTGTATGGSISFGIGGGTAVDAFIERTAAATLKITSTLDVATITNSGGASVAVNDDLDLAAGKQYKIDGTRISSADLSDAASLATQTYVKEGYVNVRAVGGAAGTYAAAGTDNVLLVGITSGTDSTVTLPASVTGKIFTIIDSVGYCGAGTKITLDPNSTETINGQTTYDMQSPYESITLVSLGTAAGWVIL